MDKDRNPEWPDPIPNESTVIAAAIASRGGLGHHGDDDYATCTTERHWEKLPADVPPGLTEAEVLALDPPPMTDWQRQDLADEIELDML